MRYLTSLTTKVMILVALPLIALVVVAGFGVQRTARAAARAHTTAEEVDLALLGATVAQQLSREGELSASAVAFEAEDLATELAQQRQKTDKAAAAFEHAVGRADEAARLHLADAVDSLDRIDNVRRVVDAGLDDPNEVVERFAALAEPALATDRLVAGSDAIATARRLDAYLALTRAIHAMSREQTLVEGMLRSGVVDSTAYLRLVEAGTSQRHWLDRFEDTAPTEDLERYGEAEAAPVNGRLARLRDRALAAGPGGSASGDATTWSNTASRRIDALESVAHDAEDDLATTTAAAESAAATGRTTALLWFLLALVLALGVVVLVRRLVLSPMPKLSRASHPAAETLPRAVELAETKREAMNTVFLNFGRRTQDLVTQQLSHIDSLEARADNPDTLADLFLLDHLATRLRRNAESLVVLAGAASPRPWARPVSVTNVVRAGVAEATDYSRIDVVPMAPAMVVGTCANDISHLVAELIDTALDATPRRGRVTISGRSLDDSGYLITVADVGPSRSPGHLAEANVLIAHTPLAKVDRADSFGLFVVGQIARRYEIIVRLVESARGGIAAEVLLPPTLVHYTTAKPDRDISLEVGLTSVVATELRPPLASGTPAPGSATSF